MSHFKNTFTHTLGYLFIALICSAFVFIAIDFAPHDFANYYFGGFFFREGLFSPDIYFPHLFNQEIEALGHKNLFVNFAPNTPFLGIVFYPFTFFSLAIAKIIFNSISLILFLYSLKKIVETFAIKSVYLYIIPFIFLIPIRNNFLFGQVYLLLFFLLTEGFLAYRKNKISKMAFFWSFAIMLKVFPVLLFGMLLFKKKYKAIIYLCIACVMLLGVSILLNGFDIWEFYFKSVLPKSGNGEIAGEYVQNYQSMFMFLKYAFPSNMVAFSMFLFLFKLGLLVLSYFVSIHERSKLKLFAFWMLISILISPYGSTYTNLLLLFPFFYILRKSHSRINKIIVFLVFILITTIPVPYFSEFPFPFSFPRLWLLLLLLLILFKRNLSQINWKQSVIFIVPLAVIYFFLIIPEEKTNNQFSLSKNHILTYDYEVKDGVLHYNYWSINGEKMQSTETLIKSIDTTSIYLIDNQIFYQNKQLTFGKDNKLKPAIINDHILIYLSDINKGIGFYSLVKSPFNYN